MQHSDFKIGSEFFLATGRWRCTDIGTRTIVAIHLNQADPSYNNGPPYVCAEKVLNEYDQEACVGNYEDAIKKYGRSITDT